MPAGENLNPDHWREFSKGIGFRYFGVGEYGESSTRPHYHAVLYGLDCMEASEVLAERWPYGFTQVRPFAREHAPYISGYVVKKMRDRNDPRLEGRVPEFARMSRRPALGTGSLVELEKWLGTRPGVDYLSRERDVPKGIRVDGQIYPLGRTLVEKLRESIGICPSEDPRRYSVRKAAQLVADLPQFKVPREARRAAVYHRVLNRRVRKGVL